MPGEDRKACSSSLLGWLNNVSSYRAAGVQMRVILTMNFTICEDFEHFFLATRRRTYFLLDSLVPCTAFKPRPPSENTSFQTTLSVRSPVRMPAGTGSSSGFARCNVATPSSSTMGTKVRPKADSAPRVAQTGSGRISACASTGTLTPKSGWDTASRPSPPDDRATSPPKFGSTKHQAT